MIWPYNISDNFQTFTLISRWTTLDSVYKLLHFNYPDDQTRVDEYIWIVHQLNKFISRQETSLGKCLPKLEDVLNKLNQVIENGVCEIKEGNQSSRAQIVYYYLRDDWLIGTKNLINQAIQKEKEERLEDGSTDDTGWFNE